MNTTVLFYIPNLVNYFRLLLIMLSIYLDKDRFLIIYSISSSIDIIDGTIARYLNQTSKLGACLDMFTDRLTTTIIISKILQTDMEKRRSKTLILVLFVDLMSHSLLFTSSMMSDKSHKEPNFSLLKIYYQKIILIMLCITTELYFIFLYMSSYRKVKKEIIYGLGGCMAVKGFFHVLQFFEGLACLSDL